MLRRTPLVRTVLVAALVLVTAAALVLFVRIDRVVVARGVLAGGSTPVYAPLDARVERVLVRSGDAVRSGDPLIVLESLELQSERARAEARITALQERARALEAQRDHLRTAGHPFELRQAELDLERARLREADAERRLRAQEKLLADKLVAELDHATAIAQRDLARVDRSDAELRRDALGTSQAAALEQLEASLREARGSIQEASLEAAELARRQVVSTLLAPIDGVVVATRLDELGGRRVLSGEELLRLVGGDAERFDGVVSDLGRAHVRAGLPVRIRVDGYPWLLHGTVSGKVAFTSSRTDAGGEFPVEVALEGSQRRLALRDGMHASARILVEEGVPLGRLLFEDLIGRDERGPAR